MKAVIFDIDGVLLHLSNPEAETFFDAFRHVHQVSEDDLEYDWSRYVVRNDIGIISEILEKHFGRLPANGEIAAVIDHYLASLKTKFDTGAMTTYAIPGALQLLKDLTSSAGVPLGLATANLKGAAEMRLRHAGMWDYFDFGGYAETGDGGPKSAILRNTIQALLAKNGDGASPQDIVFLGDQLGDLEAAKDNGVRFIGVSTDENQRKILAHNGAPLVVADHSKTAEIVEELLERG